MTVGSRVLGRLGLVALSIPLAALALAAAEGVLAAFDIAPPPPAIDVDSDDSSAVTAIVWDRDLLYRYAPSTDILGLYRTNAAGYRGPEFRAEKAPGVVRIACVGDSCTFGLGVREEHTWTRQLESA